jgi:hypothetical protein
VSVEGASSLATGCAGLIERTSIDRVSVDHSAVATNLVHAPPHGESPSMSMPIRRERTTEFTR